MTKLFSDQRIGVWGLGMVGQSLVRYLNQTGHKELLIHDNNPLTASLKANEFVADLEDFLIRSQVIFPSPGIDLSPYSIYQSKFYSEADLFYHFWRKSIIAVTGSFGKTTITSLLNILFRHAGYNSVAAGNIAPAMCDVLNSEFDLAILELSSFQLDLCRKFAPDLAIWTSFCPNHLDRHRTMENYFRAKAQILMQQNNQQMALLPIDLMAKIVALNLSSQLYFFSSQVDNQNLIEASFKNINVQGIFYLDGQSIYLRTRYQLIEICDLNLFVDIATYPINILMVVAVAHLWKIKIAKISFQALEHRLEMFGNYNGVDFYNDSKSTTGETTLAAVQKLATRPIILFIGGLSKGVDRRKLIEQLAGRVKLVICFGHEADLLYQMCVQSGIKSIAFSQLDLAVTYCLKQAVAGDQVLFSPAGSSYDLFQNYEQRGHCFKQLVETGLI